MRLKMAGISLLVGIPLILSGCGLWGGSDKSHKSQEEQAKKDIKLIKDGAPLDQDNKESKKSSSKASPSKQKEKKADTVDRQLFLMDKNGMVVPQTVSLPKTASVATQSLKYLVKDGPISNMLPSGFQAVLPADTEVKGANLKDDTLTVNFSKDFKNYKPKNEQKILQALTWTATQFKNVNHLKVQINGADQSAMPVNDTPIGKDGASRADGINEDSSGVVDINESQAVTVYFPAQTGDNYYYVPVTQRMHGKQGKAVATVQSLIDGPAANSGLLSKFSKDTELVSKPKLKDGLLTLNFNKKVYSSPKKNVISDEALNSLVLSLTAQEDVDEVAIKVDGKSTLKNENGKEISKPVTRPKHVNTKGL